MFARELRVSSGHRFGAIVLGAALLVVVGVFLAFGFVLLVGLAAAGLILGIGAALLRRLAGRPQQRSRVPSPHGLDPAREVAPPPDTLTRQMREPPREDRLQ
ncbi:MAG: hypothetical protein ACR2L6_07510 [Gemmatimonadaceae bacterium]